MNLLVESGHKNRVSWFNTINNYVYKYNWPIFISSGEKCASGSFASTARYTASEVLTQWECILRCLLHVWLLQEDGGIVTEPHSLPEELLE